MRIIANRTLLAAAGPSRRGGTAQGLACRGGARELAGAVADRIDVEKRMMEPRGLKTEEEYEAALAHVETLMDAAPGSAEEQALEIFALLIEAYEEAHCPIDPPDPVEAIRFRMEQQGLRQRDLVPYMGSQRRVSEVLNRKRPLSPSMARALHEGLGIPAAVLLQRPGEEIPERRCDLP